MAFLSKGGTSSKTIQRLQHEAAAKQAMAGIAKQAAAAGRVAVKAASRALLLADEQQNGADRQANAAAAATALYRGEKLMFEFERTASRLIEMQSEEYLASEHRPG